MLPRDTQCNLELKKHVNLIHCSNNLSLVQRKLFNALLFNAYPELGFKQQFCIRTKKLCEMIGYRSNDYKSLKKALLDLMVITIEWNVIGYNTSNINNNKWRASSALAGAKIEDGLCTYEYSSIMTELFYQPEIYGRINISLLPNFKSSYGLALYENCIRYYGIPQTPWFSLDMFRKLMGVDYKKYIIFRDFKKRVLDIAIKEVNQCSPLTIIPEFKRLKKSVVSIRFLLNSNSKNISEHSSNITLNSSIEVNDNVKNNTLVCALKKDFGMSDKNIENILSKYELNYIHEKVEFVVTSESFKLGKIRQAPAYLTEALKNDYRSVKPLQLLEFEKRRKQEEAELIKNKKNEEMRILYNKYVVSTINKHVSQFSQEKMQHIIEKFETSLKSGVKIIYTWFQKGKLEHPIIKALFNNFVRNYEQETFKDILTFEEFVKQTHKQCIF